VRHIYQFRVFQRVFETRFYFLWAFRLFDRYWHCSIRLSACCIRSRSIQPYHRANSLLLLRSQRYSRYLPEPGTICILGNRSKFYRSYWYCHGYIQRHRVFSKRGLCPHYRRAIYSTATLKKPWRFTSFLQQNR